MESYRKLIKFGNSSFVVSLPNKWVRTNKLEKGSVLNLQENGNNELILTPQGLQIEEKPKEITLDLNGKDEKEIQREIVSSYIYGYDVVRLKGIGNNSRITRNIVYSLIGLEIVEQDHDTLVVKSLLSLREVSLEKYVRRMDMVLKSIMDDSRKSYKVDNYEHIKDRDRDINRITCLLLRYIRMYVNNPSGYRGHEQHTMHYLFNCWTLVTNLEAVGDECKRVARLYTRLRGKKFNFAAFDELYGKLAYFYAEIMKAYYKQDKMSAYLIASESRNIFNLYESLLEKASSIHEASLIEKFKNMSSHIRGVSRAVYQW